MRNFQPIGPNRSQAAQSSIANLEQRVRLQADALQQAERDLAAAQQRLQPASRSPAAPSDPQSIADQIILAGARRRGEEPMGPSTIQQPNLRLVTDPAALGRAIINAGRRARNEPPLKE
jgi:hypothetical protein